jgi:hypothetical protein
MEKIIVAFQQPDPWIGFFLGWFVISFYMWTADKPRHTSLLFGSRVGAVIAALVICSGFASPMDHVAFLVSFAVSMVFYYCLALLIVRGIESMAAAVKLSAKIFDRRLVSPIAHRSRAMTAQVNAHLAAKEILKYKQLLDSGVISQSEFDRKRDELRPVIIGPNR